MSKKYCNCAKHSRLFCAQANITLDNQKYINQPVRLALIERFITRPHPELGLWIIKMLTKDNIIFTWIYTDAFAWIVDCEILDKALNMER